MTGYTSIDGILIESQTQTQTFNANSEGNEVMEAIAAGSSIITFIQIAASTYSAITDIIQRFQDAPEEFRQIARQLRLLQSELNFISNLEGNVDDDNLALLPDETRDVSRALEAARSVIVDVRCAGEKYRQDGKRKGKNRKPPRLLWVFHDQPKMKNLVSRLQQIQISLHTILLLVNIRITNLSRNAIATASSLAITSNATLLQDVAAIRKTIEEESRQGKRLENIVLHGLVTRDPHDKNQFWKSIAFLEESWLHYLGIEAVLSMYGNDYQTTYNFSLRYRLYRVLGLRLISLDLRMRRFPIAGLGLSFIAGGLRVKNVVPENSEIMTACKRGGVVSVRELFHTRRASPNNVTAGNSSPLRYIIENGSKDLV